MYDMDDINFSEIVVHDRGGLRGQLVVNPNPTANLYHAPAQKHFIIDDLNSLAAVPSPVQSAARDAQVRTNEPWIILGVLFGPWILYAVLSRANRTWSRSDDAMESG